MTLENLISQINNYQDEQTVFAKKVGGQFSGQSEVILIELTEEELEVPTSEIAAKKCPGFEYFLEIFLIKEIIEDFALNKENPEQVVNRIIYYAENDA